MRHLKHARNPRQIASLVAATLLVFLLPSSQALAQPVVGDFQPDRLSLGTVRVGATVEASVRIFGAGKDTAGMAVKTQPPRFVRVTDTRLGTQKYGEFGNFVVCDVSIALDTARAGEFTGKIKVQIGEIEVDVPVAASILEQEPGLSRVLIVETPFKQTGDPSILDPWLELVKSAKLDVHCLGVDRTLPVLRKLDLSKFDVVLLGGSALRVAREGDFEKLKTFVSSGGRVVIAANRFMSGSVAKANEFVVPFGLRMTDTEPAPKRNDPAIEIEDADIAQHNLTTGVGKLRFHRPSPVAVEDEKRGKILVAAPPFPDAGFVAVAQVDRGQVVVLGVSLWWNWIASEKESGADNARLLQNLLSKP